jgi:hypothetical protein
MKRLMTALLASAVLAAAPAWAGGGHGHGHDKHQDKWEQKAWKKDRKAWEKEQKHWAKHGGFREREVVNNYYYPAPPVVEHRYYVERSPAAFVSAPGVYAGPGVVSAPGVFIGFSN